MTGKVKKENKPPQDRNTCKTQQNNRIDRKQIENPEKLKRVEKTKALTVKLIFSIITKILSKTEQITSDSRLIFVKV